MSEKETQQLPIQDALDYVESSAPSILRKKEASERDGSSDGKAVDYGINRQDVYGGKGTVVSVDPKGKEVDGDIRMGGTYLSTDYHPYLNNVPVVRDGEHWDAVTGFKGETTTTEYDAEHAKGIEVTYKTTRPGLPVYRGGGYGKALATVGLVPRQERVEKEIYETKTVIQRHDKDGNLVYEHTSKDPKFAEKIASFAAKRIIKATESELSKERDLSDVIDRLRNPAIFDSMVAKSGLLEHSEHSKPWGHDIDDSKEHAEKWHQHGIVTHSLEFEKAIDRTMPEYLEKWGLANKADEVLSERIDGSTKRQLLQIASLLHDIGKFTARKTDSDNPSKWHFDGHDDDSGKIILGELHGKGVAYSANERLKEFGLTDKQIEYVAKLAKHHFELGKVRKGLKEKDGYTIAWTTTPEFKEVAQEIIDNNSDIALEIGLMFIADGLSKTEVYSTGETDEAVESQRSQLEGELKEKNLNPNLINQALQMPVNMKVAQAYLNQWKDSLES